MSGGIPGPSSFTSTHAPPRSSPVRRTISPPSGVASTALFTRVTMAESTSSACAHRRRLGELLLDHAERVLAGRFRALERDLHGVLCEAVEIDQLGLALRGLPAQIRGAARACGSHDRGAASSRRRCRARRRRGPAAQRALEGLEVERQRRQEVLEVVRDARPFARARAASRCAPAGARPRGSPRSTSPARRGSMPRGARAARLARGARGDP